jgi:hypothetical protein
MDIKKFTNTNLFIYNNNVIKVYPFKLNNGNTLITSINNDDIIVQKDTLDELIDEFNKLGFINDFIENDIL